MLQSRCQRQCIVNPLRICMLSGANVNCTLLRPVEKLFWAEWNRVTITIIRGYHIHRSFANINRIDHLVLDTNQQKHQLSELWRGTKWWSSLCPRQNGETCTRTIFCLASVNTISDNFRGTCTGFGSLPILMCYFIPPMSPPVRACVIIKSTSEYAKIWILRVTMH